METTMENSSIGDVENISIGGVTDRSEDGHIENEKKDGDMKMRKCLHLDWSEYKEWLDAIVTDDVDRLQEAMKHLSR